MSVKRRGSTHLDLEWSPPQVINGILTGYLIKYEGEASMKSTSTEVTG